MIQTDRTTNDYIRQCLIRLETAIEKRPGFGRALQVSTTRCDAGLACETTEGDHFVRSDLPSGLGGQDSAPSPGLLVRAALGSCLAMGYRLRAARHEIPLDEIVVVVETDSVLAGMLDSTEPSPPGFTGIRTDVQITSSASESDLRCLVEEADRLSPVLDVMQRANAITGAVRLEKGDR